MDYWKANLSQSLQDTWYAIGTAPLVTVLFTLVVLVITFKILKGLLPADSMSERLIETIVGLFVLSFCAVLLFLFCIFSLSPSQIYHGQNVTIIGQLKTISKLTRKLQQSPQWTEAELNELDNGGAAFERGKFYRDTKRDWKSAAKSFEEAYVSDYQIALKHPEYWGWTAHIAGDIAEMYNKEYRTNEADQIMEVVIAIHDANPTKKAAELYNKLKGQP